MKSGRSVTGLRGFNTTQIGPLSIEAFGEQLFEGIETEIIDLPNIIETLLSTGPERAKTAIESDSLTLRIRDALPYGLAISMIGLESVATMMRPDTLRVFVDTNSTIAREWASDAGQRRNP